MVEFDVLTPSDIWWLTTARRNFYQPVLARIYCDSAIKEVWLPFHDVLNMYPQNITVRLKLSVDDMQIVEHDLHVYRELFDECPTPSSPEMMITVR